MREKASWNKSWEDDVAIERPASPAPAHDPPVLPPLSPRVTEDPRGTPMKQWEVEEAHPGSRCIVTEAGRDIVCGRMDVVMYGSQTLPLTFKGHKTEANYGMVLISCGTYRRNAPYSNGAKEAAEATIRSSFVDLKLMPKMPGGSEAIAYHLLAAMSAPTTIA
ncbi:hypothetical protein LTR28_009775 [Elasticomyces elasticus]|nr:hypothetical protein LTR28_009775 [Elasticomyces elasticus]